MKVNFFYEHSIVAHELEFSFNEGIDWLSELSASVVVVVVVALVAAAFPLLALAFSV